MQLVFSLKPSIEEDVQGNAEQQPSGYCFLKAASPHKGLTVFYSFNKLIRSITLIDLLSRKG